MSFDCNLDTAVKNANTGLDAIKRAPIVERNTGIKCLRIQDVSQSKEFDNWGFTDVTTENFKKFQLKKDDILIARTGGSIGVNRYIPQDTRAVYNNGLIRIRVDTKNFYPKFVFYLLQTTSFQQHINSIAFSTAAQPNMKIRDFLRFEFVRLELDQQIKIADALSVIDSKIELNRQTNQTLEQIAQALFKSWFVDFEPTRAKIAAKEAGASPEEVERAAMCAISGKTPDQLAQLPPETQQTLKTTAALFPDALVDSEFGEMPEGWEIGIVGDLFELHRGFDLPSTDRQDGEYPVFSASGYHGCHDEFKMEPPGIITGRSGVIGNVYLSLTKYWPLNTTLYVREFKKCGPYYAYFFLSKCDLKSINSGSAVPSLNRNFVHSLPSILPNDDLLKCFEVSAKKIFAELKALELQSEMLSSLRDTLLPKLLSGEVSIS